MKIIACCALALVLGLSACRHGPDIKNDPVAVGQTVSLAGTVKHVHAPGLVDVDTSRGNVLVVTTQPTPALKAGERVEVTGDVRHLTVADFERTFTMDADPLVESRVTAENFVAAREIKST
jgi:hypothetical protein